MEILRSEIGSKLRDGDVEERLIDMPNIVSSPYASDGSAYRMVGTNSRYLRLR